MPIEVRTDTTIVRSSVAVRQEHLRGGQRYRYGGQYLVPIDGREDFVERDIDARTGRPKVLERVAAVDSLGQGSRSSMVAFVVFIDSQGKIRGARPLGAAARDNRMIALARQALELWRFAPAVTRTGRPVTDWIEVQVEVRPSR